MAQPRRNPRLWIGILGGILLLACAGCGVFSGFWSISPAGRAAGAARTATAQQQAHAAAASATTQRATAQARTVATHAARTPALPQVGSLVTVTGWAITVTQLGWTTTLWDWHAQVARDAAWRSSKPNPRYWLVWLDARNTGARTAPLREGHTWRLFWSDDYNDYGYDSSGDYALPEGRAYPDTPVAPGALTHALLVFAGGADPPVALEVDHYVARSTLAEATIDLVEAPAVVHFPEVYGPETAVPRDAPPTR